MAIFIDNISYTIMLSNKWFGKPGAFGVHSSFAQHLGSQGYIDYKSNGLLNEEKLRPIKTLSYQSMPKSGLHPFIIDQKINK